MKEARFYEKLGKNEVQCNACEWHCKIREGGSGICGVRQNQDGILNLIVYGKAADAYPDWIEKKKLAHFMPGEYAFSIGTVGCNFRCDFCLNWKTSQFSKIVKEKLMQEGRSGELGTTISDYGYDLPPEDVIDFCKKKDLKIVAFTYNEPTVFVEYALDIAKLAKESGIKCVFVTNGYMSKQVLPELAAGMSAISFDLKSFSDDFYKRLCGGRLQPVLRNIEYFVKNNVWIEITTLIIPGENDSDEELRKIAEFIAGLSKNIPWHISRFSPDYKLQDKAQTSAERLYSAFDIGKKAGLKYIYFGNLWDSDKTSTLCPNCGKLLIHRDVYNVDIKKDFDLGGKCKSCGEKIAGVWK
ncbi:AmmeMemoRadiSam system radical SAM enzyme [Candidatus Dojkabacteria bacterium]|nr:AmmeMemoRadiSam system radical SAM enzyme [Candidatus Dojkabacteria bacterium]